MEELKKVILESIAEQVKKTALTAAGTTSQWNMYQPEEPKILTKE